MPSAQPRGARGTVGHPYSALNLRLLLATMGVLMFAAIAVLLFMLDEPALAWIAVALVAVGVVDLVVVGLRIRARRRTDPERHSLFE